MALDGSKRGELVSQIASDVRNGVQASSRSIRSRFATGDARSV